MEALLLDGSHPNDPQAASVREALRKHLPEAEIIPLCEQKIGNCAGDFFCWTRNPGICNVNDDNRILAAKIMRSDLVVYLTPVTFGGYSSQLKRMVDHQIQNVLPFFQRVNGEIHHQKRYKRYPHLLTVGWIESTNNRAEAIFRNLVHRNAINMFARTSVCDVVIGQPDEESLTERAGRWLEAIRSGSSSPVPALPAMGIPASEAAPVRRALLLVGSPRTKKSTSAALGGYLFDQLESHGVETRTIYTHTSLYSQARMEALYETLDQVDLVLLAFPLYVDSLPGPVMGALEKIAAYCKNHPSQTRFAAIVNCGFPEASHNDTALAICSEFGRQAGFQWLGGLSLGGGEGLVHGVPLEEMDGRAIPLKQALDLAAGALANGQPVPRAAQDLFAKPVVPGWVYSLFGSFGWRQQARKYGMHKQLKRQPYL